MSQKCLDPIKTFTFCTNSELLDRIDRTAKNEGVSRSELIREAVLDYFDNKVYPVHCSEGFTCPVYGEIVVTLTGEVTKEEEQIGLFNELQRILERIKTVVKG